MTSIFKSCADLYKTPDLKADFLCSPMRSYHGYLLKTFCKSSSFLQKTAILVAWLATGIFAYPVLGFAASTGIFLKWTQINEIKDHNQSIKVALHNLSQSNRHCQPIQQQIKLLPFFNLETEKNELRSHLETLNKQIDKKTRCYRKVHSTITTSGDRISLTREETPILIRETVNAIQVSLAVFDPA